MLVNSECIGQVKAFSAALGLASYSGLLDFLLILWYAPKHMFCIYFIAGKILGSVYEYLSGTRMLKKVFLSIVS